MVIDFFIAGKTKIFYFRRAPPLPRVPPLINPQIPKNKNITFKSARSMTVVLPSKKIFDLFKLIDSRIEVAADAQRGGRRCGCPPQVLRNKADAVRPVRLKGKFGRSRFFLFINNKSRCIMMDKNMNK
jgi:hypothetical protein